ncbi:MAG: hypothetical protein ACRD1G_14680, partial [Acidimicrobiales bacterium]
MAGSARRQKQGAPESGRPVTAGGSPVGGSGPTRPSIGPAWAAGRSAAVVPSGTDGQGGAAVLAIGERE